MGDRVQFFVCFTKKIEDDWGPSMAFTTGSANMSDYEDDLAENWEGVGMLGVGLKKLALRIVPRSVVRWRGSDRDYFFCY